MKRGASGRARLAESIGEPAHRHVHHQSQRQHDGECAGTTVAEKGQGDAHHRQKAGHHADVDGHLLVALVVGGE